MKRFLFAFVLLLGACWAARPQTPFVNLDFEDANVQDLPYPGPGEAVNVSDGVPGWIISPTIGGGLMGHNSLPIGGAAVEILGPAWPSSQLLQGIYTVALYASIAGPPTLPAIAQTGQIPAGSHSVLFYGAGDFGLSFAGQNVPLTSVGSSPNYTIFGGDVSMFAGQTGQLLFQGNGLLDNISFSPSVIPEPGVLGLLALGAALLKWHYARGRARHSNWPHH